MWGNFGRWLFECVSCLFGVVENIGNEDFFLNYWKY